MESNREKIPPLSGLLTPPNVPIFKNWPWETFSPFIALINGVLIYIERPLVSKRHLLYWTHPQCRNSAPLARRAML